MNRRGASMRPAAGLIALLAGLFLVAQLLVLGAGAASAMPMAHHEPAAASAGHPHPADNPGDPCAGGGLARLACLQHCTVAPVTAPPDLRLPVAPARAEPAGPAHFPPGRAPGVPERPPR